MIFDVEDESQRELSLRQWFMLKANAGVSNGLAYVIATGLFFLVFQLYGWSQAGGPSDRAILDVGLIKAMVIGMSPPSFLGAYFAGLFFASSPSRCYHPKKGKAWLALTIGVPLLVMIIVRIVYGYLGWWGSGDFLAAIAKAWWFIAFLFTMSMVLGSFLYIWMSDYLPELFPFEEKG